VELTTADFARAATTAYRQLDGFVATEKIRAGAISATARIRARRPGMCTVEFESYASPLVDLEEHLVNGAEYTPEELIGMSLVHDGRRTLLFDPSRSIAVLKPSRSLFEPLPGYQALGELGFLDDLPHDFLLRDAGEETVDGRAARLLGFKPKQPLRSHLLKTVAFPIRRAVVAFDKETKLPLRIRFHPSRNSVLWTLLRPDEAVTIEYTGMNTEAPDTDLFSVSTPPDARLFRERHIQEGRFADALPFFLSLDPLLERGYRLVDTGGTVAVDDEGGKGYCTIVFSGGDEPEAGRLLTLRAGNFLSPNMSRRKATLAENGDRVQVGPADGYLLDRAASWRQELSEQDDRELVEAFWTRNDVFWFLSGDGIDRTGLAELASALAAAEDDGAD